MTARRAQRAGGSTTLATLRKLAGGLLLLVLAGCASLPAQVERTPSYAMKDTSGTTLGRVAAPLAAAHPGLTGIHPLRDGREAFAARHLLASAAERSIDVQYYIWRADTSGKLVAHALWQAAERGVRVRMLLDDANTNGVVPTRQGTNALVAIAARGVRVSVLTNSLASTDVTPTYAGYARYRDDLLRGGIRLFELKPAAEWPEDHPHRRSIGGSSGASLHAKTFAVDRRRIFVGSFNLDPRSTHLNTESGLLLESPVLATELSEVFARDVPLTAYEVRLDASGGPVWIERIGNTEVRHTSAPQTSLMRRIAAGFLGWLPIEWLL